jgi:hypothetical protein
MLVILNPSTVVTLSVTKGLAFRLRVNFVKDLKSRPWKTEILRLPPQNDMRTQSPEQRGFAAPKWLRPRRRGMISDGVTG